MHICMYNFFLSRRPFDADIGASFDLSFTNLPKASSNSMNIKKTEELAAYI